MTYCKFTLIERDIKDLFVTNQDLIKIIKYIYIYIINKEFLEKN